MKKNLFFYGLLIASLILSQRYFCLKNKCNDLKTKTKNLSNIRSNFEYLTLRNNTLKNEFDDQCFPLEQTVDLVENLVDKKTWDEFAHDQCLAPNAIKDRFCNTSNVFYQGHLSFFALPEQISNCMQTLSQVPVWPFTILIKRKQLFNPVLQITIEYFFAAKPTQNK